LALQPHEAAGEIGGVEQVQVVDALADPDCVDRQLEGFGEPDENAALCRSIQLGDDETGDGDHLAERLDLGMGVLADSGVEDQQHIVRRAFVLLADHAHDLLQLRHEVGLVVEATGGIDEENVVALVPGLAVGVEEQAGGVRPGGARHNRATRALAPDLELLDGGSAESVAGGEHYPLALGAESGGELADRGGLAAAVDADDEDHMRAVAALDVDRLRDRLEDRCDVLGERLPHLFRTDLLVEPPLSEIIGNASGGRRPQVGHDQELLELLDAFLVELAVGEDAADAFGQPARGLREAGSQPAEPAAATVLVVALAHAAILPISVVPSAPAICAGTSAPSGTSSAIRTGANCSEWPAPSRSTSTVTRRPICAPRKTSARRSPAARRRAARSRRTCPGTCGIRAAGVPSRAE